MKCVRCGVLASDLLQLNVVSKTAARCQRFNQHYTTLLAHYKWDSTTKAAFSLANLHSFRITSSVTDVSETWTLPIAIMSASGVLETAFTQRIELLIILYGRLLQR
jgi:uncharacterized NAD-dependent epimerase/dehydratase family protein